MEGLKYPLIRNVIHVGALRKYVHSAFSYLEGGVPVEVHQALQAAMEKLQQRFTSLMQEKADLKERVEELEHRCIQLSGETDTIGESLTYMLDHFNCCVPGEKEKRTPFFTVIYFSCLLIQVSI